MVLKLQERVNDRTKKFDLAKNPKEKDLSSEKKEQVQHIAQKQATVEELTRTMSEKFNREEE